MLKQLIGNMKLLREETSGGLCEHQHVNNQEDGGDTCIQNSFTKIMIQNMV